MNGRLQRKQQVYKNVIAARVRIVVDSTPKMNSPAYVDPNGPLATDKDLFESAREVLRTLEEAQIDDEEREASFDYLREVLDQLEQRNEQSIKVWRRGERSKQMQ